MEHTDKESYILSMFYSEKYHYNFKNVGIFTRNMSKAKTVFDSIFENNQSEVQIYLQSKNTLKIILNDGMQYIWVNIDNLGKGYRFSEVYIDKDLSFEDLDFIFPRACTYCAKDNVTII